MPTVSGTDLAPRGGAATRTTLLAVIVVALTFVCGLVVGMLLVHLRAPSPRPLPPFAGQVLVNRLDRRLDLTDEQRARVEEILERHHARIREIQEASRPRVRAEIESANAEISRILTPEQRREFERMKMHMRERRRR